jgi:multicomponent Na+:H+ antiporter subunit C
MGSAVNLFLISLGYRDGSIAPIFTNAPDLQMVMPAPQALTLTSIVINIAVVALMLSFAIIIYQHNGTLDSRKRRLKG